MTLTQTWKPSIAIAAAIFFAGSVPGNCVTIGTGATARIDFVATTAPSPFDFVTFTLNFSNANPFGPNEAFNFSTFNSNNLPLASGSVTSGNSVFTSGLFGALTENAIVPFNPASELTTTAFHAFITPTIGSFDLMSAQANFEHIIFTTGANQLGVPGSITAPVPGPLVGAGLPGLIMTIGGFVVWRRRRRQELRHARGANATLTLTRGHRA